MLKYSIIIPTCNESLIKRSLEYISKLNKPKCGYEVLAIHNASKEDIKSVVDAFQNKIPNLRYIFEQEDGLMASRHRGAKEALGEILCYLDDDSFVDKDYLIGIEETYNDKNVVMACGPNQPLYESTPPKWLKYFWNNSPWGRWMGELSLIDLDNKIMGVPAWFAFGCNMTIKKTVFFNVGGTNPDCMPPEKLLYTGDGETALSLKLNKAGYYAIYNPKIKIEHFVPTSRMTQTYFEKRSTYQAICDSYSQIRRDNGIFTELDFIPTSNLPSVTKKQNYFIKKIKKFIKRYERKISSLNINYNKHLQIKDAAKKAHEKSYKAHQEAAKENQELLNWILKETYLD